VLCIASPSEFLDLSTIEQTLRQPLSNCFIHHNGSFDLPSESSHDSQLGPCALAHQKVSWFCCIHSTQAPPSPDCRIHYTRIMPFRYANPYGGYDFPAFPATGGFDFIDYDAVADPLMSPYDTFPLANPPDVACQFRYISKSCLYRRRAHQFQGLPPRNRRSRSFQTRCLLWS